LAITSSGGQSKVWQKRPLNKLAMSLSWVWLTREVHALGQELA